MRQTHPVPHRLGMFRNREGEAPSEPGFQLEFGSRENSPCRRNHDHFLFSKLIKMPRPVVLQEP
jgi:hypothetical protein